MNLRAIETFHKTRPGYLLFGLVELGLSYLVASLALGSGNVWEWALVFFLFMGFLQNLVRMIWRPKK